MRTIRRDAFPNAALFKGTERGLGSGIQPKTGPRQHKSSRLFVLFYSHLEAPGIPTGIFNLSRSSEPYESVIFPAEQLADSITLWVADVPLQQALVSVLQLLPVPTHLARSSSLDFTITPTESSVLQDTTRPPLYLQTVPQRDR